MSILSEPENSVKSINKDINWCIKEEFFYNIFEYILRNSFAKSKEHYMMSIYTWEFCLCWEKKCVDRPGVKYQDIFILTTTNKGLAMF